MKQYTKMVKHDDGTMKLVQVHLDVVIGNAILALVESGIDEDAHFWDSNWHDIDDDDLEFALNDSATMLRAIEYIRLPLIEKLNEVLAERREETEREKERGR